MEEPQTEGPGAAVPLFTQLQARLILFDNFTRPILAMGNREPASSRLSDIQLAEAAVPKLGARTNLQNEL